MTTPTGQISMSQIRLEIYGSASGSISLTSADVRTLAGVPSGAISMSNCKGKSWVTFTPSGGALSDTVNYPAQAQVTITCSQTATWTWTRTSGNATASIASGGTGTSITFTQTGQAGVPKLSAFTVSGTASGVTANYTVDLDVEG